MLTLTVDLQFRGCKVSTVHWASQNTRYINQGIQQKKLLLMMGLKEEFISKLKMNPSDYILEKVMSFELLCLIFKVWVCTEEKGDGNVVLILSGWMKGWCLNPRPPGEVLPVPWTRTGEVTIKPKVVQQLYFTGLINCTRILICTPLTSPFTSSLGNSGKSDEKYFKSASDTQHWKLITKAEIHK